MPAPATKTKTDIIKEYLDKHPGMGATELAARATEETKVEITARLVTKVRAKLKADAKGTKKTTTAKPKTPKAPKADAAAPAATAASAPSRKSAALMSQHIANIKSAVAALGKDEARRILELF